MKEYRIINEKNITGFKVVLVDDQMNEPEIVLELV